MKTKEPDIYFKQTLLDALKKRGLPCTYTTLYKYEKKGIIPKPENSIYVAGRPYRAYSMKEIENIVEIVGKYVKTTTRSFKN